ncbi:MAG TPA: FecR domain-containing protein, partial [Acidobacteriota bacterium]|nr:FecR domain-containing protein [Acidobacteriota bacterium]
PNKVRQISDRVWNRIAEAAEAGGEETQHAGIRSCADFQSLIPEYLRNNLSEGRTLLFEDHMRVCLPCRKALIAARTDNKVETRVRRKSATMSPWLKWGSIAATVMLMAFLMQSMFFDGYHPWTTKVVASVQSFEGHLFTFSEDAVIPVAEGYALTQKEVIRTGKNSGAVLELADGSLLEMADRTELEVVEGWSGTSIQLKRGNVIVEAADQGSDSLYVYTGECQVAVKGTVFSVSHGMKGSRVAVIEGEVWVEKGGENTVLKPGQQFASQPHLGRVALEQEFDWSRNAEQHLALLSELHALGKDLSDATFGENLRYSSELAGILPAETVVYGALPNISGQIEEVYQLFQERLQDNPLLSEWLKSKGDAGEGQKLLDEMVQKLGRFGEQVGEEIVVAMVAGDAEHKVLPVMMASVVSAETLRAFIEQEVSLLNAESGEGSPVAIISDPSSPALTGVHLYVLIRNELLAVSPSLPLLQEIVGLSEGTGGSSFVETPFFIESVEASYANGVDWLLAVNLEKLIPEAVEAAEAAETADPSDSRRRPSMQVRMQRLGVNQVRNLVIERKQVAGASENRAVLAYDGTGEGMVSWIAEPGPMGGLDFVSQDAHAAAAFVVNRPAQLVADVFDYLERTNPDGLAEIRRFEMEHQIDIAADIAAPLGGELIFALDGPILPTPSWKVVLEVYQPDVLQSTLEMAIGQINVLLQDEGQPGLVLESSTLNGLLIHSIRSDAVDKTVYYAYVGTYLVAAPDPTLISQAVQYAGASYSLANSREFVALLPKDQSVNMSGFLYHNLGPLLSPLASLPIGGLSPEGQGSLQSLLKDTPPMMVSLYAEPNEITVSGGGDFASLWMNMNALAVLGGPEGIAKMLQGGTIQ